MLKKPNFRFAVVAAAAAGLVITGAVAGSAASVSWSYQGANGPSHWGSLSPDFVACVDGTAQSPINIKTTTVKRVALQNIKFNYNEGESLVFNNGHTVEAEPAEGAKENSISIGSKTFGLLQVHFHAPSEHQINGMHYPAEFHFVNKLDATHLAVVGVFIKQGSVENAAWKPFIDAMAKSTATPEDTPIEWNWSELLPENQQTFRYRGSLTTPGCAQIVAWNVMKTPVLLSADQIQMLIDMYDRNNRPVQPLNGREVKFDTTAAK